MTAAFPAKKTYGVGDALQRTSQPMHVALGTNLGTVSIKSITAYVNGHHSYRVFALELEGWTEERSYNHVDE